MRLKAAIIGCGNIAGGYDRESKKGDYYSHIKSYQANNDVKVVGVFDPNPSILIDFAKYWKVKHSYDNLSVMLHECKPNIVSICSPNEYHCDQIRLCVEAGVKTILCEKPLAFTWVEANEVFRTCQENNVSLVINYIRSWDNRFRQIEEELKDMDKDQLESIHLNYNKGVFHNASHFIVFFNRCLGMIKNISVITKERFGNDAYADFLLSYEKCDKVYFFNHRKADCLITEMDLFFKSKRLTVLKGGQSFKTEDYKTGKIITQKGTIHQSMRNVIDDIIAHTRRKSPMELWVENQKNTLEATRICETIVRS